jgi:hypothetical protein
MSILEYLLEGLSELPKGQEYVSDDGDVYDVSEIARYAEPLPDHKVLLSVLNPQAHAYVWKYPEPDGKEISIHDVLVDPEKYHEHYDRMMNADTKYPIIMAPNNEIIDGNHRLGKAIRNNMGYISVKRIPDWELIDFAKKDNAINDTQNITESKIYPDDNFSGELILTHNKEASPNMGSTYGQDVEPAGYYAIISHNPALASNPNYETVKANIKRPLIIDVSEDRTGWKRDLAKKYKAKKSLLSKKLMQDGYDSIITTDSDGDTGEIIILNTDILEPIKKEA